MLDKIKELLGEELASKVTAALGTVELAVMNDGSVVKADKYETLKSDHGQLETKYQTDVLDANTKLEAATKNAGDYETLKGTLEGLKTDNLKLVEQFETDKVNMKKNSAVEIALLKANVNDKYLNMAKTQLNMENLIFDGDNLVGLDDSIEKLRGSFTEIFGEVKKVGGVIVTGVQTKETDTYKAKYDEAISNGHTREAIKIKQKAFAEGEIV